LPDAIRVKRRVYVGAMFEVWPVVGEKPFGNAEFGCESRDDRVGLGL